MVTVISVLQFPEGLAAATAQLFSPFMSGVSSPSTNGRANASREATNAAPPDQAFQVCRVLMLSHRVNTLTALLQGSVSSLLFVSCFCKMWCEMMSMMVCRIGLWQQHPPWVRCCHLLKNQCQHLLLWVSYGRMHCKHWRLPEMTWQLQQISC
jgi:hypothetical protein